MPRLSRHAWALRPHRRHPAEPQRQSRAGQARYPNCWVELPIYTHLPRSGRQGKDPLSRNHINVLSCDAIVALPGGAGTASEVELAVLYGRPVAAYLQARWDIPGLPMEVPVFAELAGIQQFVREALRDGSRN